MIATLARAVALLALTLLAACGGGGGGDGAAMAPANPAAGGAGTPVDQPLVDPASYSAQATASLASAAELAAVTHHRLALDGVALAYTATAGHLTARDAPTGAPKASFFYVAYTLDGADARTRPVTFLYNGGPGSATAWLHLGSFGPRRLVTGIPATTAATPFPLVDNRETLLDVSDLVFVDAPGTGFSEAIAPNTNQAFYSVDADAAVFRDFVIRYLDVNARHESPKFLFGESYGTTRSAVLAYLLESAGVTIDGVALQSSILDYNTNCGIAPETALSCAAYLPSYSATGAWYDLDNPNPAPSALAEFLVSIRALAADRYDPAARAFLATMAAPDPALIVTLVGATGLAAPKWQLSFNVQPSYFQSNLIAGTLLGRYDSRVSTPLGSFLARNGDPSSDFVAPSFATAITSYLGEELKYSTGSASSYVMVSRALDTWDFTHDTLLLPDTVPDLAAAFAHNPRLRVIALSGYHDLATPFFQTERDLARLAGRGTVELRNYAGGHMTYLDDAARVLEKADLVAFYRSVGNAP